jgi:hypothetical protein
MSRRGTTLTPGLVVAIALTYVVVGSVLFAAGYVIGRLVL